MLDSEVPVGTVVVGFMGGDSMFLARVYLLSLPNLLRCSRLLEVSITLVDVSARETIGHANGVLPV